MVVEQVPNKPTKRLLRGSLRTSFFSNRVFCVSALVYKFFSTSRFSEVESKILHPGKVWKVKSDIQVSIFDIFRLFEQKSFKTQISWRIQKSTRKIAIKSENSTFFSFVIFVAYYAPKKLDRGNFETFSTFDQKSFGTQIESKNWFQKLRSNRKTRLFFHFCRFGYLLCSPKN